MLKNRKEIFLARMGAVLPWARRLGGIELVYPKAGNGHRPCPFDTMQRIHSMQQWYNLSDGAMENARYEMASMCLLVKRSLDRFILDRTTVMNFRHLLERHQLTRKLFDAINQVACDACACIIMEQGLLVDASIIEAPSFTKNKRGGHAPSTSLRKVINGEAVI